MELKEKEMDLLVLFIIVLFMSIFSMMQNFYHVIMNYNLQIKKEKDTAADC